MAWHTIAHVCGHQTERQIYGPNTRGQRDQEAARLAAQDCPDCWRASRRAAQQQDPAAAGLPGLTGSERQVVWATDIRAAVLAELDRHVAATPAAAADAVSARAALLEMTEARWWIDRRAFGLAGTLRDTGWRPPTPER